MKIRYTKNKKRILCWHDSPVANTGFGIVARNILRSLYDTGRYDIDVIGINHTDLFYNRELFPYEIIPATLAGKNEVYGNSLVLETIAKRPYDIFFVMNDTFATSAMAEHLRKIREKIHSAGHNPFRIIYYYPVDCALRPDWVELIKLADRSVAYTHFGRKLTEDLDIDVTDVIYHGVDTEIFRPLTRTYIRALRAKIFGITGDTTFIWGNFNRNSLRKDVAKTILAFSKFKKAHPNCILYLHMAVCDGLWNGGVDLDLRICCEQAGLEINKDVFFPADYHAGRGISPKALNEVYNCMDGVITTTISEGFGLSTPEAMATGTPVVVPDNTSFPEIVGENRIRGYMYPCKEEVMIDSSGYRKLARLEDIVTSMKDLYKKRYSTEQIEICRRAREWTEENSWKNITEKQWVPLFRDAEDMVIKLEDKEWL
jgi:glycosyltransferase involved in cell wall biosynthesis